VGNDGKIRKSHHVAKGMDGKGWPQRSASDEDACAQDTKEIGVQDLEESCGQSIGHGVCSAEKVMAMGQAEKDGRYYDDGLGIAQGQGGDKQGPKAKLFCEWGKDVIAEKDE
jgi:hypothetical protein